MAAGEYMQLERARGVLGPRPGLVRGRLRVAVAGERRDWAAHGDAGGAGVGLSGLVVGPERGQRAPHDLIVAEHRCGGPRHLADFGEDAIVVAEVYLLVTVGGWPPAPGDE